MRIKNLFFQGFITYPLSWLDIHYLTPKARCLWDISLSQVSRDRQKEICRYYPSIATGKFIKCITSLFFSLILFYATYTAIELLYIYLLYPVTYVSVWL